MHVQKMLYVAYYRVSTQQQGDSRLGLEGQERDVNQFTKGNIAAAYTDIESGKNNNRPELNKAIDHCNNIGAILIVAKLDRLSRDVVFIHTLMNSKVKFVCCDMPEANEITIGIMAVIAQGERKMISDRTKKGLESAKARGIKLGGSSKEHCDTMRAARKPKEYHRTVTNQIKQMRQNGSSFQVIANELNAQGLKTDRNKPYSATQVYRIYVK